MRDGQARDEAGQTSLLVVGFAVVVLLTIVLVVDASAAYLQRQGLDSLADGAALAAADGVQSELVYQDGLGERARIDPVAARSHAAEYLTASGAGASYPGLTWSVHTGADAVVVRVTAPLELPFTPPGWTSVTSITGTAAAYVYVSE